MSRGDMFARRGPSNRSRVRGGGATTLPAASVNIFGTTFDVVKQVNPAYATDDTNTIVYRRDALCYDPINDTHYMGYYRGSDGQVVIGKQVGSGVWSFTVSTAALITVTDDHRIISLAVQSNGKLVVCYGIHGEQLNFWRAASAGDTQITNATLIAGPSAGPLVAGMAAPESFASYPGFRRYSDGELMFMYRNGGSGNADVYVYSIIGDVITSKGKIYDGLTGSSPVCNFYWNMPFVEPSNYPHPDRLWVATQMRFSTAAKDARGLFVHFSDDRATTWKTYSGAAQTVPITNLNNSGAQWEDINPGLTITNYDAMQGFTVDANGVPVVTAYYGTQLYAWSYDGTANSYDATLPLGVRKAQLSRWDSSVAGASRPMPVTKSGKLITFFSEIAAADSIGRLRYITADLPALTNLGESTVSILNNKNDIKSSSPLHDSRLWDGGNGSLQLYHQKSGINSATQNNGPTVLRLTVGGSPTFQDPIAADGANIAWYVNGDNAVLSAGNVAQWTDLTANGVNFAAVGSAQPLAVPKGLGARQTALFNGTAHVLATANRSRSAPATQPYFIYMIVRQITWTSNDVLFSHCDGAGAGALLNCTAPSPSLCQWHGSTLGPANNNAPGNQWQRIILIYTGSVSDEMIIGAGPTARSLGTNTGNSAVTSRPIALGGAPLLAGRFANMELACAFERTGVPSDELVVTYDSYFSNYYGTDTIFS